VADQKISALNNLTASTIADADELVIRDTSATETKALALSETILMKWTAASASGAASLDFHEDTDNGSNRVRLTGPASTADVTLTLPAVATTLLGQDFSGASVENAGAFEMNVSTIAATGATETLDLATYNVFDLTMDQSCAFTLSNPAPSGDFTGAILIIRGAFTPSFSNTMIEPDNTALTYTTPSAWGVWTVNGGTSYFLVSLGKAFA
jgi:hypothetical protein